MDKTSYKSTLVAGSVLLALLPSAGFSQGTTTGLLDLTSLTLASSGQSVLWSGTWVPTQSTSASANGASESGTSSAASGPANSTSVATPPAAGTAGIFGLVLGQINSLPGSEPGTTSASASFSTTFTSSGGPQLTLSVALSSILTAQAGPLSAVSYSDDSFSVVIDSTTILAWSDSIGAMPNQTTPTDSQSPSLSTEFVLPDGAHSLSINLQTAQSILPHAIPEPSIIGLVSESIVVAALLVRPGRSECPAEET